MNEGMQLKKTRTLLPYLKSFRGSPNGIEAGEKVEERFSLGAGLDSSLWEESRRESSHARNSSTKKETLCSRQVNPLCNSCETGRDESSAIRSRVEVCTR